jgi:hypothetical protein
MAFPDLPARFRLVNIHSQVIEKRVSFRDPFSFPAQRGGALASRCREPHKMRH